MPSKPNSKDHRYSEGEYTYTDSYIGNEYFAGEEAVWSKELPVYAMNYYGQILSENFNIDFLKEMLSLLSYEKPFRGPEYHQKGITLITARFTGISTVFMEKKSFIVSMKRYI